MKKLGILNIKSKSILTTEELTKLKGGHSCFKCSCTYNPGTWYSWAENVWDAEWSGMEHGYCSGNNLDCVPEGNQSNCYY